MAKDRWWVAAVGGERGSLEGLASEAVACGARVEAEWRGSREEEVVGFVLNVRESLDRWIEIQI